MNKHMPVNEEIMDAYTSPELRPEERYTTLSKYAVVAMVVGVLSLIGFYFSIFMILGVIALVCGVAGYRTIRSAPHEFTGKLPAQLGMLLGLVSVFGGLGFHSYIYATEVRDGYERISFSGDLKTDSESRRAFTERAEDLDGKKIFLKGYVRPGLRRAGINEFLLVGDLGQCCFGGTPNISEVVLVKLPEDQVTHYDFGIRKIHGTFKLHNRLQEGDHIANDVRGFVYEIEADSINY